jgi:hypothetical protein
MDFGRTILPVDIPDSSTAKFDLDYFEPIKADYYDMGERLFPHDDFKDVTFDFYVQPCEASTKTCFPKQLLLSPPNYYSRCQRKKMSLGVQTRPTDVSDIKVRRRESLTADVQTDLRSLVP